MLKQPQQPIIHGPQAFEAMRRAGRITAEMLDYITEHVKPGITTGEIDRLCFEFHKKHNATPGPLGFHGYPKSVCTSVNDVICHGIPGKRVLRDGDIINIDVTPIVDGWFGDSSRMFFVGNVSDKARKLCNATHEAMMRGIGQVRPGATLGDVGFAIQSYAEGLGYSVVRDFGGHGIGRVMHTVPQVLHYGAPNRGLRLEAGMFFTVEPMLNIGGPEAVILDDGWTAVTRDKSLSAQFEHTVAVTETGYEIFTLSPKGYHLPPYKSA
ncbi:MAG: type I methionyl aminopeptidase [Rhodospirillaceae bacterium]|nr:type I methionyl aminopeptidase [Rhodospirillaceae bacterium]